MDVTNITANDIPLPTSSQVTVPNKKKPIRSLSESNHLLDRYDWSAEESEALRRAHSEVPLSDPNFWGSVAEWLKIWKSDKYESMLVNDTVNTKDNSGNTSKRGRCGKKVPSRADPASSVQTPYFHSAEECQSHWFASFEQSLKVQDENKKKRNRPSTNPTNGSSHENILSYDEIIPAPEVKKKRLTKAKIKVRYQ